MKIFKRKVKLSAKQVYLNTLTKKIDKNYSELEVFFDLDLRHLCNLQSTVSEIANCLIIEQYTAAITGVNFLAERMMKLSLIELEMKNMKSNHPDFKNKMKKTNNMFDGLNLNKTIERCSIEKILSSKEEEYLTTIKGKFRNSYSHAEMNKINSNVPNEIQVYSTTISSAIEKMKKGEKINIKKMNLPSSIPSVQESFQMKNAKESALLYFKNLCQIAKNIDHRISEKLKG